MPFVRIINNLVMVKMMHGTLKKPIVRHMTNRIKVVTDYTLYSTFEERGKLAENLKKEMYWL